MTTPSPHVARHGLFAVLALASLACASFGVWVAAQVIDQQWSALRPEIYSAMLQFLWRGVLA
jgi:hypothetical protein